MAWATFTFVGGLSAQEGPSIFELSLPDFFETSFSASKTLIELPDRRIQRLNILVKDAQKRNIIPGRYRIFVNGKGLGNVFEERTTLDGSLLVMDPNSLKKRPDELFDTRENAIEITAEDRRGRIYYQNWILRVNDSQRNALFGYAGVVSPDDPRGIPPDLVIDEPSTPIVLGPGQSSVNVHIKGRVSAGANLKVGDKVVFGGGTRAVDEFDYTGAVQSSQHELVLEAADSKGNSRRVMIPVFSQATAAPKIRFSGQKYAVLVGVSNFGNLVGAPPPLPLAAANVQEFARSLQEHGGFKAENIRTLVDQKATIEQVKIALSDFASKAQANDLLLVYFDTHGMHDPRPNRGDKLYLALYGTQIETIDSTALPFADLEILLNRSVRSNQSFLVFDVGHELNDDWKFRAGLSMVNNHVLNLFGDKQGMSVLVAGSSGDQGDAGASLFSSWLSKGLGGAADLNGDHVVTAKELFSFVSEKVRADSKGTQQPRFRISGDAGVVPIVGQ